MNVKKCFFNFILVCLFPLLSVGQGIDKDLSSKLSSSTLSRLYPIASKIVISPKKQFQLAMLFQKEDSLVAIAIRKNLPSDSIEEIRINTYTAQLGLFDQNELRAWNNYLKKNSTQSEAAQEYIKRKIGEIQVIKPLSSDEARMLQSGFLSLCTSRNESFINNFQEVLPKVINDTVIVGRVLADEIEVRIREAIINYNVRSDLPINAINCIYPLLYNQQKKIELLKIMMQQEQNELAIAQGKVNSCFKPIIDSVLMRHGYQLPKTQFANAIKYRQDLKLKEEQLDSLVKECSNFLKQKTIYQIKNPSRYYNPSAYEREKLPKILDIWQYEQLLKLQASNSAIKSANDRWAAIQKKGLDTGIDSTTAKKQLIAYFMDKLIANDRYANNKDLLAAELRNIEGNKPPILKKLEALNRNPSAASRINNSLAW